MSLFKARDWWSTTVGEEEEFDQGCLCVANIDNSTEEIDKIIIGSYHGILRIFNPQPSREESGSSGYKPSDVVLESSLQNPILQLEAGKFVSGSELLHLAVLHPRRLSVYSVAAQSGAVEHGTQYQLTLAYEHNLQRTSHSICFGPFGGIKGKDFICVQSMDGTVSVFEQESFSFSRFLPGFVLPGPLVYVAKTDSFVTVSSSWQLECYKYQVLAVATDAKTKEESQNIKSGKRITPDWIFSIGEQALDIAVVTYQQASPFIMILGERNLFCVTETGRLRFMKKFEYDVSCFCPYSSVTEGAVNYLVATYTESLMIFQDNSLKWAAKLEHVPVQIRVGAFKDLKGVIVTLSDSGILQCSYLGTDPDLFIPPPSESRDLNYADMDREMMILQKRIKEKSGKSVIMPSQRSEEDLTISVYVNPNLDDVSMASGVDLDGEQVPSITVHIQLKSRLLLENVKLFVHPVWPLDANMKMFDVPAVETSQPSELFVAFFMRGKCMPSDLTAEVSAKYSSASGAVRIATAKVKLPLKLVVKPVSPVKSAKYKLTLESNKPPANLNDIFSDLLGVNEGGQGLALGFQYFGGPVVTVLASKTSQRYRLQCDQWEGMWLVSRELVSRLNSQYNRSKSREFSINFTGQLPLQEYFELIDAHFELRLNAENCKEMLAQRASQFRAIQRRLLTRFKDKTPAPLANLDTLLEGTYRQLLHLADAAEDNNGALLLASHNLSAGTSLFNLLIKLWSNMSDAEYEVLQRIISPVVSDNVEQGWEESVDIAVTHLLRTTLAKSVKDQTLNPQPLKIPEDTSKVKKHIALLCDKLSKGARLVDGLPTNSSVQMPSSEKKTEKKNKISSTRKTVIENGDMEHHDNDDNTETLIGSQFAKSRKDKSDIFSMNGPTKLPSLGEPAQKVPEGVKKKKIESLVPDLDDMYQADGPNLPSFDEDEGVAEIDEMSAL
ncbi:hypothetical protein ACJMK2_014858 [Sinanodonta woodiana]|uniref:Protein PTHB1 n=1 Tax=Sinanodonta woodiana TaxID=1069815 RepID=A0ABD3V1W7_SINWO